MSHNHDDHPAHEHQRTGISEREKLVRMLEHWLTHNEDHERSYMEWASKARALGFDAAAAAIESAASFVGPQSRAFGKALEALSEAGR